MTCATPGRVNVCEQCKRDNQELSVMGLCSHCRLSPSMPPVEECNCEQALAIKADLRSAAAHLAEALAMSSGTGATEKRDAARDWLKAYLAKEGSK